jgi:hypothetical protein
MQDIPTFLKRRLREQVVGPIYQEMINQIGDAKAAAILDAAIRKAEIAEGREFAARAPKGEAGGRECCRYCLPVSGKLGSSKLRVPRPAKESEAVLTDHISSYSTT